MHLKVLSHLPDQEKYLKTTGTFSSPKIPNNYFVLSHLPETDLHRKVLVLISMCIRPIEVLVICFHTTNIRKYPCDLGENTWNLRKYPLNYGYLSLGILLELSFHTGKIPGIF